MVPDQANQPQGKFLTVGEAARYLGVSPWTLRNWDRLGKLKPIRHPISGYRIYRCEELDTIRIPALADGGETAPPPFDWTTVGPSAHIVEFYENDGYLMDTVSLFMGTALEAGCGAVIVATRGHRRGIH